MKELFEEALRASIAEFGEETPLRNGIEYALTNGGKRIRPLLVLSVAEGIGKGIDVMPAALSAEYFHTSSLIADDMPCMDDAEYRRGKPATHKKFGESVALLASYALISAGFEKVYDAGRVMCHPNADKATIVALECAARNAGINGATGGQYLDLFDTSGQQIREMIFKKTVTLFEAAFVFGWVFGGGSLGEVALVKEASHHFGMAFQIADDLADFEEDAPHKNIARFLGVEKASTLLEEELDALHTKLTVIGLDTPAILAMAQQLSPATASL